MTIKKQIAGWLDRTTRELTKTQKTILLVSLCVLFGCLVFFSLVHSCVCIPHTPILKFKNK